MTTKRVYFNRTRIKFVLIPLGVTVLLVGLLLALRTSWEDKEPLTPRQILDKQEWTKQELTDTMCRMSIQQHRKNSGIPKEVYTHIRQQLKKLAEVDRQEITMKVIADSVEKGGEIWRTMEPEARQNLLKKMKGEAERNRQAAAQMTPEEKAEVKDYLNKPETREIFEKVQHTSLSKLTPEERRDLAPIVKEWIKTLENL